MCRFPRGRRREKVLTRATDLGYSHRDIAAIFDVLRADKAVASQYQLLAIRRYAACS